MEENTRPQLNYLQEFEFEKTPVFAGMMTTGEAIALKPVVENLGLDWSSQRKRIERDEILSQLWSSLKVVSADGKLREMKCFPPSVFQDWLWNLNQSKNLNFELWENYKRGLVVHLLLMLKISLDEIKRLSEIESDYILLKKSIEGYFNTNDQALEHNKIQKQLFKETKEMKDYIRKILKRDPNQTRLF